MHLTIFLTTLSSFSQCLSSNSPGFVPLGTTAAGLITESIKIKYFQNLHLFRGSLCQALRTPCHKYHIPIQPKKITIIPNSPKLGQNNHESTDIIVNAFSFISGRVDHLSRIFPFFWHLVWSHPSLAKNTYVIKLLPEVSYRWFKISFTTMFCFKSLPIFAGIPLKSSNMKDTYLLTWEINSQRERTHYKNEVP